jgi:hypothetical protein
MDIVIQDNDAVFRGFLGYRAARLVEFRAESAI